MASYAIEKITLAYDEREDRLRLAVQDAQGQSLALWLTQRLANRLARALVNRLDAGLDAPTLKHQAEARAVLQGWEQAAAQAQFAPCEPVRNAEDMPHGLIDSIDIGERGAATQLVLRWPGGHAATLVLAAVPLRQWLGMLHQQYAQAGWPGDGVWPAWLAEPAQAEAPPSAVNLMH